VAAASAGCNAEYDSDIDGDFEPLAVVGLKKPAAKDTNEDVYEVDELFQDDTAEDNVEEDMEYYRVNSTGRRGHSLSSGGPPRPDTSGISAAKAHEAIKVWRVLRKAHTDKMQREHRTLFGSNAATEIEYSGVVDARLRLMSDVDVTPLLKGHTSPTKEILLIQIAEEANFCGCQIAIVQSNNYQVYVRGCAGSLFQIEASCSVKLGWKVATIETREVTKANDDPPDEIVYNVEEKVADKDEASLEEDDADRKLKAVRQPTPIKSCWIVPLLLNEIAGKPNISNAEMKHVVSAYVKEKFITSSLLQNARTMARDEIFCDPATNVFFANGLVDKMKECGVDVKVLMKDQQQVLWMLEPVVLSDHMHRNKAEGKLMMKAEKIEFVSNWKLENKKVLEDGGLGEPELGAVPLKFFSGILFSTSGAQKAIPFLQQVFQADACHMNFGKYTLYPCYSTTANCNTYPVAFRILFGNEDKEG
jgi:hypothetical protein